MAHLFKNKKIKAELENYEIPQFEEKIAKVKAWHDAYKNKSLQTKTESQCEQAFNQHFFIEILGYVSFPSETYTIDPKGTADASGQKADAVLGHFNDEKKRVTAVVEIKDVNTSLDKSQQRAGNLSPIQQAFKYKPQYKDCAFVIATNFFEIRLFRDNQLDYEVFTLETLTDPKDNYYQFRKFYYLLNAENFVIKHGKSVTEKLLTEIRVEQEKITKAFYGDYKGLRQSLINNLVLNNQNHDIIFLIEKAQKIIDRVVFICFCEDLELLPENKLQEVVFHTEKMGLAIPIWDIMKGFFIAIDKGSKKLEIPDGYNGELFKEDLELNNLRIDDAICKKFVDFGKYDFSEDLSVNILGHIFEQSISDIEELKSLVEEKAIDKKKSKRKKDGIFYTPDYIVDYIVKNSLGQYLEEREKEIMEKHGLKEDIQDKNYEKRALQVYQEYREVLRNVKVLDPACGSGAFLVKVFDYLLAENIRVGDIIADFSSGNKDLFSDESYIKELLENNIFGVDLNPESVEITKLSLWLKTAIKGKKLVNLKKNIKCGNSLIDDPEFAGNRAFDWNKEFPEIMGNGGFDVIVGNPPYLRVQGLKEFFKDESEYYESKYKSATGRYDIYVLFIEKAVGLLKVEGKASFILPHKFMNATFGKGIRTFLIDNNAIEKIISFGDEMVFEDASTYTCILTLSQNNKFLMHAEVKPLELEAKALNLQETAYKDLGYDSWNIASKEILGILDKIKDGNIPLKDIFDNISQGIVTIGDDIYLLKGQFRSGEFVGYSDRLQEEVVLEKDILRPILKGDEVKKYSISSNEYFVIYPHLLDENGKTVPMEEENFSIRFPKTYNYLKQFKEELTKKKIRYKTNPKYWYALHRSREIKLFEQKKIITPEISLGTNMTFDEQGLYHNTTVYSFIAKEDFKKYYYYLIAVLNCNITWFYLKNTGTTLRGGYFRFKTKYIENLCIPKVPKNYKEIEIQVKEIIATYEIYNSEIKSFIRILKNEFNLNCPENIVSKLDEYNDENLIEKLKLKKSKIDLITKEDLLKFIDLKKQKIKELRTTIKKADQHIDRLIAKLYHLSEKETNMINVDTTL